MTMVSTGDAADDRENSILGCVRVANLVERGGPAAADWAATWADFLEHRLPICWMDGTWINRLDMHAVDAIALQALDLPQVLYMGWSIEIEPPAIPVFSADKTEVSLDQVDGVFLSRAKDHLLLQFTVVSANDSALSTGHWAAISLLEPQCSLRESVCSAQEASRLTGRPVDPALLTGTLMARAMADIITIGLTDMPRAKTEIHLPANGDLETFIQVEDVVPTFAQQVDALMRAVPLVHLINPLALTRGLSDDDPELPLSSHRLARALEWLATVASFKSIWNLLEENTMDWRLSEVAYELLLDKGVLARALAHEGTANSLAAVVNMLDADDKEDLADTLDKALDEVDRAVERTAELLGIRFLGRRKGREGKLEIGKQQADALWPCTLKVKPNDKPKTKAGSTPAAKTIQFLSENPIALGLALAPLFDDLTFGVPVVCSTVEG